MKIRKNKTKMPIKVVLNNVDISSKRDDANQVRYIPKKVKMISQYAYINIIGPYNSGSS